MKNVWNGNVVLLREWDLKVTKNYIWNDLGLIVKRKKWSWKENFMNIYSCMGEFVGFTIWHCSLNK